MGKTTTLHEQHTFQYISLPSLHNTKFYSMKMTLPHILLRTELSNDNIFPLILNLQVFIKDPK